jgi:hypothetical protein
MVEKPWNRPVFSISVKGKPVNMDKEPDGKVHYIDVFYDRHMKLWTILCRNKSGDQIGEAEYDHNRKFMEKSVNRLKKQYNVSIVKGGK